MKFEFAEMNGYRLVRITEDITRESDLNELKSIVRQNLDSGTTNLAVSFTHASNFYSPLIAVLVQFLGYVKEHDGNLAVVHPNEGMLDVLKLVGLGKLMLLYTSEDKIGT
jgi:anti-anti-sigma regulatory factor